jgi:hypothetical protein
MIWIATPCNPVKNFAPAANVIVYSVLFFWPEGPESTFLQKSVKFYNIMKIHVPVIFILTGS